MKMIISFIIIIRNRFWAINFYNRRHGIILTADSIAPLTENKEKYDRTGDKGRDKKEEEELWRSPI